MIHFFSFLFNAPLLTPRHSLEFDYERHQAIAQIPSADHDEGIVCQEFQKGYAIGERLIRPAMVAVSA